MCPDCRGILLDNVKIAWRSFEHCPKLLEWIVPFLPLKPSKQLSCDLLEKSQLSQRTSVYCQKFFGNLRLNVHPNSLGDLIDDAQTVSATLRTMSTQSWSLCRPRLKHFEDSVDNSLFSSGKACGLLLALSSTSHPAVRDRNYL